MRIIFFRRRKINDLLDEMQMKIELVSVIVKLFDEMNGGIAARLLDRIARDEKDHAQLVSPSELGIRCSRLLKITSVYLGLMKEIRIGAIANGKSFESYLIREVDPVLELLEKDPPAIAILPLLQCIRKDYSNLIKLM